MLGAWLDLLREHLLLSSICRAGCELRSSQTLGFRASWGSVRGLWAQESPWALPGGGGARSGGQQGTTGMKAWIGNVWGIPGLPEHRRRVPGFARGDTGKQGVYEKDFEAGMKEAEERIMGWHAMCALTPSLVSPSEVIPGPINYSICTLTVFYGLYSGALKRLLFLAQFKGFFLSSSRVHYLG